MKGKLFALALAGLTIGILGSCQKDNGNPQQNSLVGELPGEFSVSATRKVRFSKGNLMVTINNNRTPATTWKFAENQYDYLGDKVNISWVLVKGGDFDLFSWSTASSNYGITSSRSDETFYGDFIDWGTCIGDGSPWRTLSNDEWTYLLENRTMADGKDRYTSRITYGGNLGLVLYPDDYHGSALDPDTEYTDETFPGDCVFLPAAGCRSGVNLYSYGDGGFYWSSSASHDDSAYYMEFWDEEPESQTFGYRSRGQSVRLVKDVAE